MTAYAKGYGGPPKRYAKADVAREHVTRLRSGEEISMNKQDLIAKIAKDTG